jgi:multidrug transporter EmrE-like cation transporter
MGSLTPTNISLFLGQLCLQILGLSMLPLSHGFTRPLPAVVCVLAFGAAMWLVSRILMSGVHLSMLVPLGAAAVPLAGILLGALAFHEPLSWAKLVVLLAACGLIAVAGRIT